jgi:two-component system, chemotaxis family, sensor kinase CheA
MRSDTSDLRGEFLDDFYAECDELLGNLRTQLAPFEARVREGAADPVALEALYRNVHSFKGISAIVGLRIAEELAHAAEGLLRMLSRSELVVTSEHVDLIAHVTQRLEQIVTAHRLQQPFPRSDDLVASLARFNRATSSTVDNASSPAAATATSIASTTAGELSVGAVAWKATFTPSAELDQRGVNINSVRTRLSGIGTIESAAPIIQPGGRMTFEFKLALREVPADLDVWKRDGIHLASLETRDAGAPAAAPSLSVAPSHIVRVDLTRLDDLMRIVGEMVIHRSRLDERIGRLKDNESGLQEVNLALARSLRELREAITRVRLVPVAEIFARLPIVVRDLTAETGKKVRVVFEGQETEIDKFLVERLKQPLLHLVRNAISHGIETPAERVRLGKPEEATLRLRAATSGQSVLIQVRDDGRGVDARKIVARAASLGIQMSDSPSDADLLAVISRPGFSTRDEADRASGRGVGMAVVHSVVRDLSGSLSLESVPGRSTEFTLRLPLTLSIAETLLVSAAGQPCAVPQGFVEEVMQFSESDVRTIKDAEVISYRDGILPLLRLRKMFGAERSTSPQLPLLVLSSERGLCGLVVDKVLGQREVVVRAMHDPLIHVNGISGATELGDGRPVLILDPAALSTGALRPHPQRSGERASLSAGTAGAARSA